MTAPLPPVTAALEAIGISRRFGGLEALAGVTVSVAPATVVGVIGPNGAGKSTLVNILTGHLAPSAGTVRVAGRDVTGAPAWKLARAGVVRTFQVMRPFGGLTVAENVAVTARFARRGAARAAPAAMARALHLVGLAERAEHPAEQLSVADARRLELARALAAEPTVLVLDEILAGLSPAEVASGLDLLLTLKQQGLTMVVVEHHMGAVRALCDELLVLERGRPVTAGPTALVLADDRVVRAYLGSRYPGRPA